MMYLIRYGEIHLKGLNRPHFEKLLKQAIADAMRPFEGAHVEREQGRFFVTNLEEKDAKPAEAALRRVFGIHSISPVLETDKSPDLHELKECAAGIVSDRMQKEGRESATFKVEAKRADKSFPMRSMEIAADVGGYILENVPGLTVDVHEPQIRVYVEVRDKAYAYTELVPGAGGLPQGSSGRGMLLLSGGIDSPVAGYAMARRGLELNAVHYHSFPYTSEAAKQKVVDLAQIVSTYAGRMWLHIVPFTEIQTTIHETCPPEMLVLLMRRFMMRIAERLAQKYDCLALITGENLGQVASQTLESLDVTDCVVDMPVFRPLIALDKIHIMNWAQEIGTYETSIQPYEDCCTVFVPKHPMTRPTRGRIEQAERSLDIEALVDAAVDATQLVIIEPHKSPRYM